MYAYASNSPLQYIDPYGLFFGQVGFRVSATVGAGGEISGGVQAGTREGDDGASGSFDAGVFGDAALEAGFDVSADVFVGFADNPDAGPTDALSYTFGPFALDFEVDPTSGDLVGGSVGLGVGTPVGAAVGKQDGGDLTAGELLDFLADLLGNDCP